MCMMQCPDNSVLMECLDQIELLNFHEYDNLYIYLGNSSEYNYVGKLLQ